MCAATVCSTTWNWPSASCRHARSTKRSVRARRSPAGPRRPSWPVSLLKRRRSGHPTPSTGSAICGTSWSPVWHMISWSLPTTVASGALGEPSTAMMRASRMFRTAPGSGSGFGSVRSSPAPTSVPSAAASVHGVTNVSLNWPSSVAVMTESSLQAPRAAGLPARARRHSCDQLPSDLERISRRERAIERRLGASPARETPPSPSRTRTARFAVPC